MSFTKIRTTNVAKPVKKAFNNCNIEGSKARYVELWETDDTKQITFEYHPNEVNYSRLAFNSILKEANRLLAVLGYQGKKVTVELKGWDFKSNIEHEITVDAEHPEQLDSDHQCPFCGSLDVSNTDDEMFCESCNCTWEAKNC